MFGRLRIGGKILVMLTSVLALVAVGAILTTIRLISIAHGVTDVAEDDVPISIRVAEAAQHQLWQAHYFQHTLRFAEAMAALQKAGVGRPSDFDEQLARFEVAVDGFHENGRMADRQIASALGVLARMAEEGTHESDATEEIARSQRITSELTTARRRHNVYLDEADRVFGMIRAGSYIDALAAVEDVDIVEDEVSNLLADKTDAVGQNIIASARTVEENATGAVSVTMGVGILLVVLAFILGLLLSRTITVPIRNAADVAQRISEGERQLTIDTSAADETGDLMRAMEHMVNSIRTAEDDIRNAQAEVEEQLKRVQDANVAIREQGELILELGAPVVQVAEGVLMLPLVGDIDTQRASQITEKILDAITKSDAAAVILDLTSVPGMDTSVARNIMKTVDAVRILGAEVVVTGFSPEAAQTIAELGVDFGNLITRGTLKAGVAAATRIAAEAVNV